MNFAQFQQAVFHWMIDCFGPPEEVAKDRPIRFVEEALELAQCTGVSKEQAVELVEYVYSRPEGVADEEVGDVLLTLAGVASARGVSMKHAAYAVMDRAHKNRNKIIAKRKMRPTDGSAKPC